MKNTVSNLLTINFAGTDIQVDYKPGYRPLQFMFKNRLTDEEQAGEMFQTAKETYANKIAAEVQSSNLRAIKASQKVAWKGGTFQVTTSVEYDAGQAGEEHRELIEQWKNKKALESVKAENRANEYLKLLDSRSVKVA